MFVKKRKGTHLYSRWVYIWGGGLYRGGACIRIDILVSTETGGVISGGYNRMVLMWDFTV